MAVPNPPDAIFDYSYVPNLALRLLDLVDGCLATTPTGAPADKGLYHGASPADCCDSLTVWLETLYPASKESGLVEESRAATVCGQVSVAQLGISLVRPCWPTIKDNPFSPFPLSSETTLAAADLMMDAIAVECCIMNDIASPPGQSVIFGGAPLIGRLSRMNRKNPQGGCAGWSWFLFVQVGACCN